MSSMIKAKGYGTTSEGVEEFDAIQLSSYGDTGVLVDLMKGGKLILKFSLKVDEKGFETMCHEFLKGKL